MIRVNYCDSCGGGRNFGDQLTPWILDGLGRPWSWSPPAEADLVLVGSILSKLPDGWKGTVAGAGFIRAGVRRDLSKARVLAIRGELSRRAANLRHRRVLLADPGILVADHPAAIARALGPAERERARPLVVPHYVDKTLAEKYPEHPTASPLDDRDVLIGRIRGAELVITSSLHVLVAADALGVPQVWAPAQHVLGDGHKFRDYASAYGLTIHPWEERLTPAAVMAEKQTALRSVLTGL